MITAKDYRFIKIAKKIMIFSDHPKYRIGSIIVRSNRVINRAVNSAGPPAFFARFPENLQRHSEITCISHIDRKLLKNSTIYVAGETVASNPILCRPCKYCLPILQDQGIKRMVYLNREGNLIEEYIR